MGSSVAWIAMGILLIFIICSIFAPFMTPYGQNEQDINNRLKPPSWCEGGSSKHILGTDELGRDMLTRILYGSRSSILVGVLTALLSGGIGITLGLISGYFPKADMIIMRIADIQLAFPSMLLALAIVAVVGGGFFKLILVLGITGWVSFSRVIRSEVLSIRTSAKYNCTGSDNFNLPSSYSNHLGIFIKLFRPWYPTYNTHMGKYASCRTALYGQSMVDIFLPGTVYHDDSAFYQSAGRCFKRLYGS